MAPKKKLNTSHVKKIWRYWLNNLNHKQTADKLDVARSTYYAFLREMGLEKYSEKSDAELLECINKYQGGHMQTWGYQMLRAALKKDGSMFHFALMCKRIAIQITNSHFKTTRFESIYSKSKSKII